jgi:hypothetical protein
MPLALQLLFSLLAAAQELKNAPLRPSEFPAM